MLDILTMRFDIALGAVPLTTDGARLIGAVSKPSRPQSCTCLTCPVPLLLRFSCAERGWGTVSERIPARRRH